MQEKKSSSSQILAKLQTTFRGRRLLSAGLFFTYMEFSNANTSNHTDNNWLQNYCQEIETNNEILSERLFLSMSLNIILLLLLFITCGVGCTMFCSRNKESKEEKTNHDRNNVELEKFLASDTKRRGSPYEEEGEETEEENQEGQSEDFAK